MTSKNNKNKNLTGSSYTCVVCDSQDIDIFIEIPDVPVYCNVLWPTREEALNAPKADMRLGFCRSCGHTYNFAFDPDKVDYTQNYENSLHYSPRFQEYAEELATRLVEKHNLYDKDIIEIGCGRGDFLRLLCEMGGNRGVGFDPSHAIVGNPSAENGRITFVQDFYSERYAHYKADLVCSRHVLEHIQFPLEFLSNVRRAIDQQPDTVIFFEVPNVTYTLNDLGIWDLIYEHCSYFSKSSLARAFSLCDYRVFNVTDEFAGQFLTLEALPTKGVPNARATVLDDLQEMTSDVGAFADNYESRLEFWQRELAKISAEGLRAVLWGGGSKGVSFLNTMKVQDQIKYVLDISPRKQGKFVPGTGQELLPPNALREYQPDVIIVMNPIYLDEIRQTTREMGLSADLVTA